jgi:hypothetical protein
MGQLPGHSAITITTESREISALKPHPENYNRHPASQVEMLRRILRLHGLQKPVVIQPDGTILAGHGLVEAAKAEGWAEISCHVYDGPNPRAFLVADNRSAQLAEPDIESLLTIIREEDQAGMLAATAYDEAAMMALLASVNAMQPKGDELVEVEPPEPPAQPVTQPGDIWLLGQVVKCPRCGRLTDV